MTDPVLEHCERMIREGSKSFAAAARIFDRRTRESAYMLYAWCRYCDDQVDLQDLGRDGPQRALREASERLDRLVTGSEQALGTEPVDHPPFAGLQRVVARHDIPRRDPFELLEGFRMDVEGRRYKELPELLTYCYRVAGVVGVMMARIMGVEDEETLDRATDLGLAFQMTNIARDVLDDARAGRVYLPLAWLRQAGVPANELDRPEHASGRFAVVARLLAEADRYYASSLVGISRLRFRHAWAIAAARRVYRAIGRRILEQGEHAGEKRVFVGPFRKLTLVLTSALEAAWVVHIRRRVPAPDRTGLWTRPRSADGR